MKIAIEQLQLEELQSFLREQAEDAFPDLIDTERFTFLSEKWFYNAEFCTCREEAECLVGMIVFYANRSVDAIVYIPHIYVKSEFRGKKIMSTMLTAIRCYTKNKGFKHMRLEVQKDNLRAQLAYGHYGFSYLCDASEKSFYMQFDYYD